MSKQHNCCCVLSCPNTASLKPDLAFFPLPTDQRRDEWLRLISREEVTLSRSPRVCKEHFSRDDILFSNTRMTLKKTAFPSRCLPFPKAQTETNKDVDLPSVSKSTVHLASNLTQTDNDLDDEIEDSKAVVTSNSTNVNKNSHNKFYDLCDTYLTKDLASLIKANDSLKFKNIKSNKEEFSQFCYNLYQTSPQAYQFFQSIYGLPNCDILVKQYLQIDTKVNDTVMMSIKARVDKMSDKDKNCSVLVGSVKLKANLCYNIKEDKIYGFQEINGVQSTDLTTMALVVMIRGLFSNWKQPIGYILVSQNDNDGMIQNWMCSVIKKLFEIGLNVRTLVSSTKDDWINALVCEGSVSVDTPYLLIDDKKIYHIFDAPDLIKSARDCMILHDIHFQDKVAKYEDLINFYNADQKKMLPYAHKLTESHISPKNKEKQEVKYAIQLMSKTVANGLWNYIHFDLIKNANIGTVEFISNINNLFDILNVSKQNLDDTGRKRVFCKQDTHQDLKEILLFFQNLKVINPKNGQDITLSVKFIQGILVTVKAVSLLFDDLQMEGYTLLLTKNLHRKALEDYTDKLASCLKKKLTTLQFTGAFKKLFLSHLKIFTQNGSTKGEVRNFLAQTCQLDEELAQSDDTKKDLFIKVNSTIKISNPRSARTNNKDEKIAREDYDHIDTLEKHYLMYICGYLLVKGRKKHKLCHIFKHYLYSHVYEPSSEIGRFRRYNQHMQNKKEALPAAPCDSFIQFVEKIDEKFVKAFTGNHLCQRIADSLYKDIIETKLTPPCTCFPKKHVVKLFIRIKIFYMIRMNNRLFKTNRGSRKYLTVPKL